VRAAIAITSAVIAAMERALKPPGHASMCLGMIAGGLLVAPLPLAGGHALLGASTPIPTPATSALPRNGPAASKNSAPRFGTCRRSK
jgi:hypothetical protein